MSYLWGSVWFWARRGQTIKLQTLFLGSPNPPDPVALQSTRTPPPPALQVGPLKKLTSSRSVADGKHSSSKLPPLDLLDELLGVGQEALDPPVLPVGHAHLPPVRQERQAVGNREGNPSLPVRPTFTWMRRKKSLRKNIFHSRFGDKTNKHERLIIFS